MRSHTCICIHLYACAVSFSSTPLLFSVLSRVSIAYFSISAKERINQKEVIFFRVFTNTSY